MEQRITEAQVYKHKTRHNLQFGSNSAVTWHHWEEVVQVSEAGDGLESQSTLVAADSFESHCCWHQDPCSHLGALGWGRLVAQTS